MPIQGSVPDEAFEDGRLSTLILDCPECKDPAKANTDGRQCDGLREWTADYRSEPDPDHPGFNQLAPTVEAATLCPECGAPGRVWRY